MNIHKAMIEDMSVGKLGQLFRQYVYDLNLYALPQADRTGRFNQSSARFYKDNPSQKQRLIPYIYRDLVCLLRNTKHDVSAVLEQINGMLLTHNITSPEFSQRLQPFLSTKTAHFIHELNNYALCPFGVMDYDRVVKFSANNGITELSINSDVKSVNNDVQQETRISGRDSQQSYVINANSDGSLNLHTTTATSASSQALTIEELQNRIPHIHL